MLSVQDFDQILQQVAYDRETAQSDDLAVLEDKLWTKMVVASRHALLVPRFEALSAAERNYAAQVASEGRMMLAEKSRQRAAELLAIADRHRQASEDIYDEGQKLYVEAEPMLEKQRQENGEQQQQQSANNQRRRPLQRPQADQAQQQPTARTVPRREPPSGDTTP